MTTQKELEELVRKAIVADYSIAVTYCPRAAQEGRLTFEGIRINGIWYNAISAAEFLRKVLSRGKNENY